MRKFVDAGVLRVCYLDYGDPSGWPVILLHGFPYDVIAYEHVAAELSDAGARVIVPYLRGFGGTEFLSPLTPRSGQQAALAADLLALLDVLQLRQALLAGFDWGGRAACIVAALYPDRVTGLVTQNGYNVQDIGRSLEPVSPVNEARFWYQYYFHSERGRLGLSLYRRELCDLLWRMWSPNWEFSGQTFERTAQSFFNRDFVEVVIHSYRHRFALVPGDPAYSELEARITGRPPITVPAIILEGASDSVIIPGSSAADIEKFKALHDHRLIPAVGHNVPQEESRAFARAVLDLHR